MRNYISSYSLESFIGVIVQMVIKTADANVPTPEHKYWKKAKHIKSYFIYIRKMEIRHVGQWVDVYTPWQLKEKWAPTFPPRTEEPCVYICLHAHSFLADNPVPIECMFLPPISQGDRANWGLPSLHRPHSSRMFCLHGM